MSEAIPTPLPIPSHVERIGETVIRLDSVDSTNLYLSQLARQGAPHGLTVIADTQTMGRGRMGRSFFSPPGSGLYLSTLLRPSLPQEELSTLTPWAAVAAVRAVESVCGLRPDIKWVNDLLLGGKKLGGILCELDLTTPSSPFVVIGVGINVSSTHPFPPEVAAIATALDAHLDAPPHRDTLAEALLASLDTMWQDFPHKLPEYLAEYRVGCVTPGQTVTLSTPRSRFVGKAVGVDDKFALVLELPDGRRTSFSSGEVSLHPIDKPPPGDI